MLPFAEGNWWQATRANRFDGASASHNGMFDVIVIGGGFTGLSASGRDQQLRAFPTGV